MDIKILESKISKEELKNMADFWYGTMIKGTVDLDSRRVALGGDYHIESAEILINSGSKDEYERSILEKYAEPFCYKFMKNYN